MYYLVTGGGGGEGGGAMINSEINYANARNITISRNDKRLDPDQF